MSTYDDPRFAARPPRTETEKKNIRRIALGALAGVGAGIVMGILLLVLYLLLR